MVAEHLIPPRTASALSPKLSSFSQFLERSGGELKPTTNPFEVLRVKGNSKTLILYRKGTGTLTWPEDLKVAWARFVQNQPWNGLTGSAAKLSAARRRSQTKSLIQRDGPACFYCGLSLSASSATIEHLLPRAAGGNNTLENLVLACESCNKEAGHLSLFEKIKLREQKLYG